MAHHILLVEDDDGIALPLTRALTREGYAVQREAAGEPAVLRVGQDAVDLIILDLGLPDIDGLDVCRRVRENGFAGAVLILTARGAEIDRVVGLDVGADDYMAKPFGLAELLARVRALLRRSQPVAAAAPDSSPPGARPTAAPTQNHQATHPRRVPREDTRVSVDTNARQAFVGGVELPLTAKEFDVLAVVDAERGAVVTREELMEQVWDANWFGSTKTLDVTMGRLRHKLDAAQCISQIVTVRGVGFRLEDLIRSA